MYFYNNNGEGIKGWEWEVKGGEGSKGWEGEAARGVGGKGTYE